jgi:hypothetical protein
VTSDHHFDTKEAYSSIAMYKVPGSSQLTNDNQLIPLAIDEVTYFPFKNIIVNHKSFDDVESFKFQGLRHCPSIGNHGRIQIGVGMIRFKLDIHAPSSEFILNKSYLV